MTSLYVDRRGIELRLDGDALAFYENAERVGTVPIAPLDRVFLRGDVTLQSSLLGKLGAAGVGVVVLSGRKAEASMMLAQPHNDAARRVAQYRLSQDHAFCLTFAQCVVELKIREQLSYLQELREKDLQARYELTVRCRNLTEALTNISAQGSLAALRGLEGHAAAQYFAGIAAHMSERIGFTGRNRRPPRDPLNVVLSLGYTLLHADAVIALYGAGLDPYIGFYHGLDFGRESLACDVVETLRPHLDRFAVGLFKSGSLRVEDFSTKAQGCLMGKAGRARFYPLYESAAEDFRKRLTESIAEVIITLKQHGLSDMPQRRSAPVNDAGDDWDSE
jgi:CRISP-associated protein Cas1